MLLTLHFFVLVVIELGFTFFLPTSTLLGNALGSWVRWAGGILTGVP